VLLIAILLLAILLDVGYLMRAMIAIDYSILIFLHSFILSVLNLINYSYSFVY